MKLSYSLVQRVPRLPIPGASLPDIDRFPILNQKEASRVFEVRMSCANKSLVCSTAVCIPIMFKFVSKIIYNFQFAYSLFKQVVRADLFTVQVLFILS